MPKRKKYPRLPNSFGSIRYLGPGRSNPYAVHPPASYNEKTCRFDRPKALCYVDDWYVGFAVLNAYRAGRYQPGDEILFKSYKRDSDPVRLDDLCRRILADYYTREHVENELYKDKKTFSDVYELFVDWKYGPHASRVYSKNTKAANMVAFRMCKELHDRPFAALKHADLQAFLDSVTGQNGQPLKKETLSKVLSLIKQMYKYAATFEFVDQDYSVNLRMPLSEESKHGTPLWDDELKTLWAHRDDPGAAMILIMCYSGFRSAAYETLTVNTRDWYFQGGVKTAAGKDRIVPIHSAIRPLVQALGSDIHVKYGKLYHLFKATVKKFDLPDHHPHDCRHTFSRLCEQYEVNENDRKRMLGHSFGADISNQVYGHRSIEDLRAQIEKIKLPV